MRAEIESRCGSLLALCRRYGVERLDAFGSAARARIAEADAETAPPLSDAEVERHFAERLTRSLAARTTPQDHA